MQEHPMPDPQPPDPEQQKAICGVTLRMSAGAAGVQITAISPAGGEVQRVATMLDIRALCTEVLQLAQAQMTVSHMANFEAQQEAARMAREELAGTSKGNGKRRGRIALPWQRG